MTMEKFVTFQSTAVPLPVENIDTDQIIPARFLKATDRKGFGENLFRDWRYDVKGDPVPDFVLNDPTWSGTILVAGKNFGSGSSREHAAWALKDYGFQVVVSSFFADIFKSNALNNGLLPVTVSEDFLEKLLSKVQADPAGLIEVDWHTLRHTFASRRIVIAGTGESEKFEVNAYKKNCLINGFDDIDYLISIKDKIIDYEKSR